MTKRYARKLRRWLWASTISVSRTRSISAGDADVLIHDRGTHIGNFLSPATYCHEGVPVGIGSEQGRLDLAQEERDSRCTLFGCIDG